MVVSLNANHGIVIVIDCLVGEELGVKVEEYKEIDKSEV